MKKVFAVLLALAIVFGVCGTGMAAAGEPWTGGTDVTDQTQTATFSASAPNPTYSVGITYTDPAWTVSYTWDATDKVYKASVSGGATGHGVMLTNNSSAKVYYNVSVTQSSTYTDSVLSTRGLALTKPESAETGEIAVGASAGETTKLGIVTLAATTEGVAYEAIADDITDNTALATISITLSALAPTPPQ